MMFTGIDRAVFFFLDRTIANQVCDKIVEFFYRIPGVYMIVLIGVIGLVSGKKYNKWSSLIFLSSFSVSTYFYKVIKSFFHRPRPFHILENVRLLLGPHGGFSFPSGHATISFCLAAVIALRYPKLRYASFSAASLVAISRVYIGVHYPSDILTGAVIGVFTGYFITKTVSEVIDDNR